MRFVGVAVLAIGLAGCTASDNEKVKEQAHQTGDELKHDAHAAAAEVKVDAQKASREIDKGLRETREKVRGALDAPDDKDRPRKNPQ